MTKSWQIFPFSYFYSLLIQFSFFFFFFFFCFSSLKFFILLRKFFYFYPSSSSIWSIFLLLLIIICETFLLELQICIYKISSNILIGAIEIATNKNLLLGICKGVACCICKKYHRCTHPLMKISIIGSWWHFV